MAVPRVNVTSSPDGADLTVGVVGGVFVVKGCGTRLGRRSPRTRDEVGGEQVDNSMSS